MKLKIKQSVKVLLSVCFVFAAIIVGLHLLRTLLAASKFTAGFFIGLAYLKNSGKLVYWACVFSSMFIFASAVIDAILKQRIVLSPLLSAVAFLLTLIPFLIAGFVRIPELWFVAVVLAVYVFALILSMRKMSRLSLGKDRGFIYLLKNLGQVKANPGFSAVDKTAAMTLFWPMFLLFLLDLGLLGYHLFMNRQVMFRM